MMKTNTMTPQTFFKRPAISRLFKALSLFLITATLLPVSCKKDKKEPAASLMVSTFAGTGVEGADFKDGPSATFKFPSGVAVDAAGIIYIADTGNHRVRKITPAGVVSTLAGDGTADFNDKPTLQSEAARFKSPSGIAVDQAGTVYVADTGNNRIRKITPEGLVSTLAGDGTADFNDKPIGSQEAARFKLPRGIAVDQAGNVYVADDGNNRIRKISTVTIAGAKTVIVSTLAGDGSTAIFNRPTGVAVDAQGVVYVADTGNHRIRKITTAAGTATVSTLAGNLDADGEPDFAEGTGTAAKFSYPNGIAVGKDGHLYVGDSNNNRIRKITPEGGVVSTLAGSGDKDINSAGGFLDGKALAARFNFPYGVAAGADGKVYVADTDNHRIRKIQ